MIASADTSALVSFFQQFNQATMVRTEPAVRQRGCTQHVPSVELLPGDLVPLQSGDSVWGLLVAWRAKAMGGCFLCGGYRQDELGRVSAYRVDVDPADLLHQLGQVGVRRSESVQAGKATCSRSVWKAARMLCATRA